jgi:hypothetical protein
MVANHHHIESNVGGALGFLDSLGDGGCETQAEAEAGGSSVQCVLPR